MLAGFGVEALIRQAQALDRFSADDVGVDDFVDIGFSDVAVPDSIGVDHDIWAMLALVEASRLIRSDSALQAVLGEFLLEQLLQFGFGERIAASAGMARGAMVSTDEDVLFEFRHDGVRFYLIREKSGARGSNFRG